MFLITIMMYEMLFSWRRRDPVVVSVWSFIVLAVKRSWGKSTWEEDKISNKKQGKEKRMKFSQFLKKANKWEIK